MIEQDEERLVSAVFDIQEALYHLTKCYEVQIGSVDTGDINHFLDAAKTSLDEIADVVL